MVMAGEVVVDALPYIDQGYDEPGVREAVSVTSYISSSENCYYHEFHTLHKKS